MARAELIPPRQAAQLLGRTARTLRLWAQTGRVRAWRDPTTGRTFYSLEEILELRPRPVDVGGEHPAGR